MAPHTPSRGEMASAQFDATKHSWRGKYARTIVLGQGHLVTHDPVDRPPNSLGRQTNSWPVTDLGLVDQQGCTVFLKLHTAKHWWQNMLVFHLAREEEATRLIRRLGQVRCSRPHLGPTATSAHRWFPPCGRRRPACRRRPPRWTPSLRRRPRRPPAC